MGKIQDIVDELRVSFDSGKTRDVEWRREQLTQIQIMVEENHELLVKAVQDDLGGPKIRGLIEVGFHEHAGFALKNLDKWVKDEKVPHTELFGKSVIRPTPRGVCTIIGPFNYPLACVFNPLVSAIAAGNCAIIKPSELSVNCANVCEELIHKYMDTSCVRVVQGGIPETTELLACKVDHIFYTGSTTVGKIVMQAAAKNLTKVTLELGGKSPVIIDDTAKIDAAVNRVAFAKTCNVGQTCVAPDFVLVHRSKKAEFKEKLLALLEKSCEGDAKSHRDYGKIVNSRHVSRIAGMLSTTKGEVHPIASKGDSHHCTESRFVAPVVIDEPHFEDGVMKDEIFGPLLPIKSFDTLDEAIEMSRAICKEPLALYIFSEKNKNVEYILARTESGGVCVNTTFEHLANINLPFGGKGESGTGAYFGKHGFEEFSHMRSVFYKDTFFSQASLLPLPPYPDWLYDVALRIQILGLIPRKYRLSKNTYMAILSVLMLLLAKRFFRN